MHTHTHTKEIGTHQIKAASTYLLLKIYLGDNQVTQCMCDDFSTYAGKNVTGGSTEWTVPSF